jgi:hypothetical protein
MGVRKEVGEEGRKGRRKEEEGRAMVADYDVGTTACRWCLAIFFNGFQPLGREFWMRPVTPAAAKSAAMFRR